MNILFITYGLPYPPDSGARLRDYHLYSRVGSKHRVWLLVLLETEEELVLSRRTPAWAEEIDGVVVGRSKARTVSAALANLLGRRPLATTDYYYEEMASKIRRLTDQHPFDLIQIEHSFLAPYLKSIAPGFRGKTVISLHNIGIQQYRSMMQASAGMTKLIATAKWWLMRGWEAKAVDTFDLAITVSKDDQERLQALGSKTTAVVIENGVDTSTLVSLPDSAANDLLFIGTMGYPPNREAARFFCQQVLPLIRVSHPQCAMSIVGSGGKKYLADLEQLEKVYVTDRVRDPVPFYQNTSVAVVPLASGGGSRLKILEAMALGRAVVSTTLGCEGLEVTGGYDIRIADSPKEIARQVVTLLEQPEARLRQVTNARKTVESMYDWNLLANRLMQVYDKLIHD